MINISMRTQWNDMPFDCPQCGGTFTASVNDIEEGRTVRCSGGHDVVLNDTTGWTTELKRMLDDFGRNIGRKR
jgi:hypothetical protein